MSHEAEAKDDASFTRSSPTLILSIGLIDWSAPQGQLRTSMKDFGVDHNPWEMFTQDGSAGCRVIHKEMTSYEEQRTETARTQRAARCINP